MVYDSVSTFHTPARVNLQTKRQLKNLTNPAAVINKNLVKCLHLKKPVPNDAQCLQFSFYFPRTFYKPGNSLTPVHITWKAPGIFFSHCGLNFSRSTYKEDGKVENASCQTCFIAFL